MKQKSQVYSLGDLFRVDFFKNKLILLIKNVFHSQLNNLYHVSKFAEQSLMVNHLNEEDLIDVKKDVIYLYHDSLIETI